MKKKSVQSINPFKSVIQTSSDIVKAHGGELRLESQLSQSVPQDTFEEGTTFIIQLPLSNPV